jgi:hypothetical protein
MSAASLKDTALDRISQVVDQVFEVSEVYREELGKTELIQIYSDLMDNGFPPENLISITEADLTQRVKQLMAMELLGTLLEGLTPEEIRIFNEAVEGR